MWSKRTRSERVEVMAVHATRGGKAAFALTGRDRQRSIWTVTMLTMPTAQPPTARPRRPRDPERTRARILAAALSEFAAKGFAGARVARIARRARVNKRMLYHYFGNKDGLFREILGRKLGERMAWATAAPDDPADWLAYWLDTACRDTDWVRLMQWEALEQGPAEVTRGAERDRASRWAVDQMRRRQAQGLVAPDLDPA